MLCYFGGLFPATAGLMVLGFALELFAYLAYSCEAAESRLRSETAMSEDPGSARK